MSKPVLLQDKFLGMKPDFPIDSIPSGYCYHMVDFIPGLEAPLRKRGGWTYKGSLLTDLNVSAGNIRHVAYAPFSAGAQVIALDDSLNRLFDLTNSADRGVAQNHAQAPIFYRNLLIIPATSFPTTPLKYTGSGAPAALGGGPPSAYTFAVYKDRLLAGVPPDSTTANYIFFSGAGNPESWDTTNSFISTSSHVKAMAPLSSGVVVFHDGSVEIIRGSTPPTSTGPGDMSLSPLFSNVGIYGPNAYAVDGDTVYWADQSGIYSTDGAAFTDLTKEGGIKKYWSDLITNAGTGFCAVGVFNGYVWVSLLNSSRGYVGCLLCERKSRSWMLFANVAAKNFAAQYEGEDAFYFSNQVNKRAGDLYDVFFPAAANKQDANSAGPNPRADLPFYRFGTQGRTRCRNVYLTYDLRDAASDNPVITVTYGTVRYGYSTALPNLPETTTAVRKRLAVANTGPGFGFQVIQGAPSSDTRIYSLEADVHPQEASRRVG